jgi:hypothetical protein
MTPISKLNDGEIVAASHACERLKKLAPQSAKDPFYRVRQRRV